MSRIVERVDFELGVRMRLAEGDLDKQEGEMAKFEESIDGIRRLLVGVLISATTSALLLAANLLAGAG